MTDNPFAAPQDGVPHAPTAGATSPFGATTDGHGTYTVEFELQIEDYVDFEMHLYKTWPNIRLRRWFQRFGPGLFFLGCAALIARTGNQPGRFIFSAVFASVAVLLFYITRDGQRRKTLEQVFRRRFAQGRNRTFFGWHRATIDATGFHTKTQYSESFIAWPGIERVDVSPQHVLIYLAPTFCVMIPKLAFRDQAQLDAFVEAAQHYHREADQGHG